MRMTRLRADGLLLLAAIIWGTGFVAQKESIGAIGPLFFVGARFLLSSLVLAPVACFEVKRHPIKIQRRDYGLAFLIGCCLLIAASLQQIALQTTSVTNAGFLTALYMAFVPFVGRLMSGTKLKPIVLVACAFSLMGAWLLSGGSPGTWSRGDLLLLLSAIVWAIHINLITRFQSHTARPFFLSFFQYSVTGLTGLLMALIFEPGTGRGELIQTWPMIAYTGLISGGIGFTLQIVAQEYTPAAEASLIMVTESVFAAIAGILFLKEKLTLTGFIGCSLIIGGVLMVELAPRLGWSRKQ